MRGFQPLIVIMKQVITYLPQELFDRFQRIAEYNYQNISEHLRQLIIKYIKHLDGPIPLTQDDKDFFDQMDREREREFIQFIEDTDTKK